MVGQTECKNSEPTRGHLASDVEESEHIPRTRLNYGSTKPRVLDSDDKEAINRVGLILSDPNVAMSLRDTLLVWLDMTHKGQDIGVYWIVQNWYRIRDDATGKPKSDAVLDEMIRLGRLPSPAEIKAHVDSQR